MPAGLLGPTPTLTATSTPELLGGVGDRAPGLPSSIDDGALYVTMNVNEDFDLADVHDQ